MGAQRHRPVEQDSQMQGWQWIHDKPQWWPGMHEGLPPGVADQQVGTCPEQETKGYVWNGTFKPL